MRLTSKQVSEFKEQGFILLREVFSESETEVLRAQLCSVFAEESPRKVIEKQGNLVRSVYGCHTTNEVFRCLTQLNRITEPASQILESGIYVYQFKVNVKSAFGGDVWQWHQDYIFWRDEDGMLSPRVINVMIFLDEANEFNGPMLFVPGSHRGGVINTTPANLISHSGSNDVYKNSPKWISNLTADLKYSLPKETVMALVKEHGIVAAKGPAGSVLFFDSNLVHASAQNISPFHRIAIIISFNSTENVPSPVRSPRPEFLSARDCRPLVPISDASLLNLACKRPS